MKTTTHQPIQIRKAGNPLTRFPMMCAAAHSFGIHRNTLSRVLKGQFPDHGNYAARYAEFVEANKHHLAA